MIRKPCAKKQNKLKIQMLLFQGAMLNTSHQRKLKPMIFKKKATKGRKKTASKEKISIKKKQKEVNIDDARFTENLAVATEVITQSDKNPGTSEEAETSQ